MRCTKIKAVSSCVLQLVSHLNELLMTPEYFTLAFVSVLLQYPMHVAARQGNLDAVKSHVERGADINTKDDNGVSIKEIS